MTSKKDNDNNFPKLENLNKLKAVEEDVQELKKTSQEIIKNYQELKDLKSHVFWYICLY